METEIELQDIDISLQTVPSATCRICQTSSQEELIAPCLCKGTHAHVHKSCLQHWMNTSMRNTCELCSYKFKSSVARRHSCCGSIFAFLKQPNVLKNLIPDTVILIVITCLTLTVCYDCVSYVTERRKTNLYMDWDKASKYVFLVIALLLYVCALVNFVKTWFIIWYGWWKSCVNVVLLFDEDVK